MTESARIALSRTSRTDSSRPAANAPRRARQFVSALLLGCLFSLSLSSLAPAHAQESTDPAAAATTASTPDATAPAPEPTNPVAAGSLQITGPPDNAFIGSNLTSVSGTKSADQNLHLLSPSGGDPLCIIDENRTTIWACDVHLDNGPAIILRVVVINDSTVAAQITVNVLGAPTVTGGGTGNPESDGRVRGVGYPGATVTAQMPDNHRCVGVADASGAWTCSFGIQKNGSTPVTASQKSGFSAPSSSNSSAPVTIIFDFTVPDAPVLLTPAAGAQVPVAGTSYSGTGETGATVTVFAGPYSVCTALVSGTVWSCSADGVRVQAGSYPVSAVQQDPAGNVSGGSAPHTVVYSATGAATPTPAPSPSTSAPGTSAPTATSAPSSEATAAPVPLESPSTTPAPGTSSAVPPSDGPGTGAAGGSPAPSSGHWDDPTGFATAITAPGASSPFPWLQAVLLAFGALLLFALPARLLAGTISRARGGRPLFAGTSIAGRNRSRDEYDVAPSVQWNRWLVGGAALVAAATLVMLSGPVVDQPAYLRLLVAVVVGLAVVNLIATLIPKWWSSRVLRVDGSITFLPRYLLLVGVAAVASRSFDIHPALLFGLLGSVTVVAGSTAVQRGRLAAVRAGSLIALAAVTWIVLAVLPVATNFVTSLIAETVNTVILASIGSAVFVLIPIGRTSGHSILSWSPPIWAGLTVLAFSIMFAALSPVIAVWQSQGTATVLWVAAAAFAAVSSGAWAWQRFVASDQQ